MAKGKKETAREIAERVVKGAGKAARKTVKAVGRKNPSMSKQIQAKGLKTSVVGPSKKSATKPMTKPLTKPATKPLTKPMGTKGAGPKKEIVYNLPDYRNPASIAESKRRAERLSAIADLQKGAKKNANDIKRKARNTIRRIEVNEKKANDDAYKNYRREKQGKRDLTPQEQRAALADSKKLAGGSKKNWEMQKRKEQMLRDNVKNAKDAKSRREALDKLKKFRDKYGGFGK